MKVVVRTYANFPPGDHKEAMDRSPMDTSKGSTWCKSPPTPLSVPLSTEKVPLSTEKVPQYRGNGTSVLVGSRGVHRHPYCRALSLKRRSALGDLRRALEGPRGPGHRRPVKRTGEFFAKKWSE